MPEKNEFDPIDKDVEEKIKILSSAVGELMEQNHLDRALKKILEFSAHLNQYFQHKEPWKNVVGANNCIYLSVNAVRSLAIVLFPFLPESAEKIWGQLNLEGKVSDQKWESASELAIEPNRKLGTVAPLFKKVEDSEIKLHKAKLGA